MVTAEATHGSRSLLAAAAAVLVALAVALPSPAWADDAAPSADSIEPESSEKARPADEGAPAAGEAASDVLVPDLRGITAALQEAGAKVAAASEAGLSAALEAGRLADAAAAAMGGAVAIEGPVPTSEEGWAVPLDGPLTDGFGLRPGRPAGAGPFHYGADIAAACGSTVHAARDGTVKTAGALGTYGNWILVISADGISTGYAHIRDGGLLVQVGDEVEAGQPIALVGSTGASTGCHLHFEVRVNGTAIDPVPFMLARGAALG